MSPLELRSHTHDASHRHDASYDSFAQALLTGVPFAGLDSICNMAADASSSWELGISAGSAKQIVDSFGPSFFDQWSDMSTFEKCRKAVPVAHYGWVAYNGRDWIKCCLCGGGKSLTEDHIMGKTHRQRVWSWRGTLNHLPGSIAYRLPAPPPPPEQPTEQPQQLAAPTPEQLAAPSPSRRRWGAMSAAGSVAGRDSAASSVAGDFVDCSGEGGKTNGGEGGLTNGGGEEGLTTSTVLVSLQERVGDLESKAKELAAELKELRELKGGTDEENLKHSPPVPPPGLDD